MEAIFNFIVTSDWLLFSGTFIFLFLGYIFGKIYLLQREEELEAKESNNARKEKVIITHQQQQQQQQKPIVEEDQPKKSTAVVETVTDEKNPAAAAAESITATASSSSLISLQLQVDEHKRTTDPHFFTSQIPLGPQIEQRAAAIDIRTLRKKYSELKMVIVLRRDLKPTESLAAGWGSTVALENVQHVRSAYREPWLSWLRAWNAMAVAKVAVRVDSVEAMRDVIRAAVDVSVRHKALTDAAKARAEAREAAKREKEAAKAAKAALADVALPPSSNEEQEEENNKKSESKKKSKKNKNDDDDDKEDEEEEEAAEPTIPDVSELYSLPISGLIMSEKQKSEDITTTSSNQKKKSASKGPSPQPKNKPLDISTMDFTVSASEELLKQLLSSDFHHQIPCVAIGPCPVELFEGVTDSLKLY